MRGGSCFCRPILLDVIAVLFALAFNASRDPTTVTAAAAAFLRVSSSSLLGAAGGGGVHRGAGARTCRPTVAAAEAEQFPGSGSAAVVVQQQQQQQQQWWRCHRTTVGGNVASSVASARGGSTCSGLMMGRKGGGGRRRLPGVKETRRTRGWLREGGGRPEGRGRTGLVLWARSDGDSRDGSHPISNDDDGDDGSIGLPNASSCAIRIGGLINPDEYARLQGVDATLHNLRRHLPNLLSIPITRESGIADAYASDTVIFVVVGGGGDNRNKNGTTITVQYPVCTSLQELMDVSGAVVTFVSAATRTRQFLEVALGGGERPGYDAPSPTSLPRLECRIVMMDDDAHVDNIRVDWAVRWDVSPAITREEVRNEADEARADAEPKSTLKLQGTSFLVLNAEGKVGEHRVQTVKLNGKPLDGAAIGGFLSSLRGTVQDFQKSPLYGFLASAALGSSSAASNANAGAGVAEGPSGTSSGGSDSTTVPWNPFAPLVNQIRDEVVQQVSKAVWGQPETNAYSQSTATTEEPALAPVYVTAKEDVVQHINASERFLLQDGTGQWLLRLDDETIDDRNGTTTTASDRWRRQVGREYPLPGTNDWSRYARVHERVVAFVNRTIPILLGEGGISEPAATTTVEQVFTFDCRYRAYDADAGNRTVPPATAAPRVLLSGSRKVARLYGVMASWRRRFSGSSWVLTGVDVLDGWTGTPTRVRIRYSSKLVVSTPPGLVLPATSTDVNLIGSDVYTIDARGRVVQVLQEELRINNGSPRNGLLFTKNVCAAIDAGSSLGDDWWTSGIARWIPVGDVVVTTATVGQSKGELRASRATATGVSAFSDAAALTAFRIMEALVREVPTSLPSSEQLSSGVRSRLPASQYMKDDVRLAGYLNETLVKGRLAYETTWNLAVASYEAALRTNRIEAVSTKKPASTARVEWLSDQCVRLTCELNLVVKPVLGLPIMSPAPDAVSIPLRVQVVSDYVPDPLTGRISDHRLVETRLNDQLAPGDVVARWIRQLTTATTAGSDGRASVGDAGGRSPPSSVESTLWQWFLRSVSN